MSTESPAQAASADVARTNANLAQQLNSTSFPELSQMLGLIRRELGSGGEPASISGAYGAARKQLDSSYDDALGNTKGLLNQQALQSGERFLPGQVNGVYGQYAQGLEQDRAQAQRRLQFGEANAGLSQYNQLLNMLGQGSGAALNLGRGYSGNQAAAIGGLSQSSQFGSALGGAASGAAIGTSIYPGWGTAIGGVVGGAAGLLGSGS